MHPQDGVHTFEILGLLPWPTRNSMPLVGRYPSLIGLDRYSFAWLVHRVQRLSKVQSHIVIEKLKVLVDGNLTSCRESIDLQLGKDYAGHVHSITRILLLRHANGLTRSPARPAAANSSNHCAYLYYVDRGAFLSPERNFFGDGPNGRNGQTSASSG